MSERRAVEHALRRRVGVPEHAQAVAAHLKAQTDLYTVCPRCQFRRTGAWEEVTAPCPNCEAL